MNPMALYLVMSQHTLAEPRKRDGVLVRRRTRRSARRTASRSFM